ncbi:polyprenol phosphomannose-dependent alpha 1,6 mannosyltransferase MptB [Cutibacterium sp. V970]|uniref:polyprenol phosphomannose-dependent alpha 1,6 mannosyltransferase MptB n=1 Tax=Cutibacterium sp. V970 TaxID=3446481 RepID=UPI003EE11944
MQRAHQTSTHPRNWFSETNTALRNNPRMKISAALSILTVMYIAALSPSGNPKIPDGPGGAWKLFRVFNGHTGIELAHTCTLFTIIWYITWILLRHTSKSSHRWLVATWILLLTVFPPIWDDTYNYVEQGWVVLHGGNPTTLPAGSMQGPYTEWTNTWKGTTVGYPPLALYTQALAVALSFNQPWLALTNMRILGIVGWLFLAWATPRIAARTKASPEAAFWFVCANPFLLVYGINHGHNDLLALGISAVGIELIYQYRASKLKAIAGFFVVMCGALIKPTALIVLVLPVASSIYRNHDPRELVTQFRALIFSGIACAGSALLCIGLSAISPLGAYWIRPTGDPAPYSSSLYAMTGALLHAYAPTADSAWNMAGKPLCVLALIAIMITAAFKRVLDRPEVIVIITLTTLVLVGPPGRPWYLLPVIMGLGLIDWPTRKKIAFQSVFVIPFTLYSPIHYSYFVLNFYSWITSAACIFVTIVAGWWRNTPDNSYGYHPRRPATSSE